MLAALPGVADCQVRCRTTQDGHRCLVVYLVPETPAAAIPPGVSRELSASGMPVEILSLQSLPLDPEGGIDEAALAGIPVVTERRLAAFARAAEGVPGISRALALRHAPVPERASVHLSDLPRIPEPDPGEVAPRSAEPARFPGPEGLQAVAEGEPLALEEPVTLDVLLRRSAREHPEAFLEWFDGDGIPRRLAYPALLGEASSAAGCLKRLTSGPVLLVQSDARMGLTGLWACLLGGLVAVPVPPPEAGGGPRMDLLVQTWERLEQPPILAADAVAARLTGLWPSGGLRPRILGLSKALGGDPFNGPSGATPSDTALLLFTSGTTGLPKGIPLSHRNLRCSQRGMEARLGCTAADPVLNWLPLDHVAGLMFLALSASLRGASQTHVATERILEDPLRFLDLLHTSRATFTFAPNFLFNLVAGCAETLEQAARHAPHRWELGSLRFLVSGGEVVEVDAARRFEELLAPFGLRRDVVRPAFGMSETGGIITCAAGLAAKAVPGSGGRPAADLGAPVPGLALRTVDERGSAVRGNGVGQVQLRTEALLPGYFRDPEGTAEALADGWFSTGDQGFLEDGHLFVVGRIKDIIIVNGLNFGSHELEAAVEAIGGTAPARNAVVAVRGPGAQTDQIAVFFTPRYLPITSPDGEGPLFWQEEDGEALASLAERIREAVTTRTGLAPAWCLPLPWDGLPRTAAGKLRRAQLKTDFQTGRFALLARAMDLLEGGGRTLPAWFHERIWRPRTLGALLPGPSATWLLLDGHKPLGRSLEALAGRAGIRVIRPQGEPLRTPALPPDRVVDLRFLGPEGPDPLTFATGLGAGTEAPLTLVTDRTLGVSDGDDVDPRRAVLPGLLRSMARHAGRPMRHVDLDRSGLSPELLLAELLQTSEPVVAWRRGVRLVPRLRPLAFSASSAAVPVSGACFVLSGSPGSLGLLLGRHLLSRGARLALLGRDPGDSPDVHAALETLGREAARSGGEVIYRQMDAADDVRTARTLASLPAAWQDSRIVFQLEEDGDPENLEMAWRSRVLGAVRLLEWASSRPDCRLCAIAAGASGAPALEAADAAVEEVLGGRALTLAWRAGTRAELDRGRFLASLEAVLPQRRGLVHIGLEADRPDAARLLEAPPRTEACTLFYEPESLAPSAARRALGTLADAFGTPVPLRLVPMAALPRTPDGAPDRARCMALAGARSTLRIPPRTSLERLVARRWQAFLGVEAALRDNFFLLGGDSLLGVRILGRLRQDLGTELPLAEFFRNPTVEGTALALSRLEATPGRLEIAARLRLEIEALTPDELKARLAVQRDCREVGAGV